MKEEAHPEGHNSYLGLFPKSIGKERVLIELYNNKVQMRARKLRGNGYGSRF